MKHNYNSVLSDSQQLKYSKLSTLKKKKNERSLHCLHKYTDYT